ncbi:methyltransferase [Planotetraspora kaengkrachanensis]|uniref:Hydroxyneurosporene-O-methyltransferase n=1 Tax=Planotetraspora kaengkrachanensis TaxID=575193 RepID=A0A8J3VCA9_9ACTN|nr:methyltransferase [Planotetraspora kaengkrachanensis]GIG84776.1 hydroxyneurosporene-O-methyltransferase [Planotetraspora kaengkrachanensis]
MSAGRESAEGPQVLTMTRLLAGFQLSQALYVVARLDLATALLAGPRSVDDLAACLECDAGMLRRLLRDLAGLGVFADEGDDVYSVTPLGATLARGVAGSVRDLALSWMETHYAPFAGLVDTVRTGVPAATAYYGRPFFDWLSGEPEQGRRFTGAMADVTAALKADLLRNYRLPEGATVVDVGGADGSVSAQLIGDEPGRRAVVFDLPHVVAEVRASTRASIQASIQASIRAETGDGTAGRAEFVAGDFFESVPTADVYLLSAILHDWDDEACARILGNIAAAARAGARLVVIEMVLPEDGNEPHLARGTDLIMMAMLTGRERTPREYASLLSRAGFTFDRVVPGPSGNPYSVVEATLRS